MVSDKARQRYNNRLRASIISMVEEANASALPARRISINSAMTVARRSLDATKYSRTGYKARTFAALRAVSQFAALSTKDKQSSAALANSDLLPVCHPASTAMHAMTAGALLNARAQWIAADPYIDDSVRSLVASAHAAEPGSLERQHAFIRIAAAPRGLVPLTASIDPHASTADFNVGGNSDPALRIRAQLQRRDRKGRFAEMGGGFSFAFKSSSGTVSRVVGKAIRKSGTEDIDVEVRDSDALPNGVYSLPSAKGESFDTLDAAKADADSLKGVFPADIPILTETDITATEEEISKAPEAPAAAETPKPPAPRVVNGVAQRDVRLPQGLDPVDDLSEAMEKGAPWSPLLPQSYSPEVQAAVDSIYEMVDRERLPFVWTAQQGLDPETRAFDKEELTRVANTIYNSLASMGVSTDGIDSGEGWSYEETFLTKILNADETGKSYSPALLMTTAIIQRTISDIKAQSDFDSGLKSVEKLTQVSADYKHDRVMTVVPLSAIDSVLGTRRIMSQFEVGTSMGYLAYGFRSVLEASQFGYPPSMRPASRPIYGVSVPEKMGLADFKWSENYGELKFVMKDEVQGRTTYTIGDSANEVARPAPIGVVAPTSMYESSIVHAEAQMHGSISLDDVAEVIVRLDAISPEDMQMLRSKLQAAGIKLTIVDLSSSDYDLFIELKKDGATVVKEARKVAEGRA